MQSLDNSQSVNEYCYHKNNEYCYIAIIFIGCMHLLDITYITGRKHALIKKYALNKHVRLLTRLYGYVVVWPCINTLSVKHRILAKAR